MGSFCLGYRNGWRYSGEVVWCQSSENLKSGELRNGEGECHYAGFCVGDEVIRTRGSSDYVVWRGLRWKEEVAGNRPSKEGPSLGRGAL